MLDTAAEEGCQVSDKVKYLLNTASQQSKQNCGEEEAAEAEETEEEVPNTEEENKDSNVRKCVGVHGFLMVVTPGIIFSYVIYGLSYEC